MECCKTHATVVLFVQTGKLWSGLKDYETAEGCYAKAMEYAQFLLDVSNNLAKSQLQREECAVELFGLYLDRTVAAWQLQQKVIHCAAQAQSFEMHCQTRHDPNCCCASTVLCQLRITNLLACQLLHVYTAVLNVT